MSGPYAGRLRGWCRITTTCTVGSLIFFLDVPAVGWAPLAGSVLALCTLGAVSRASYWLGRAVEHDYPHARGDLQWSIFGNDR